MSPTLSLARYLRENLALTGTKIMCAQAGCGACVVTAYIPDASNDKEYKTISLNSVTLNFVYFPRQFTWHYAVFQMPKLKNTQQARKY